MKSEVVEIPYRGRSKIFRLYFFSDLHIGSSNCNEEKLKLDIETVRNDDDALAIVLGDVCDYISPRDWRWRSNGIAKWVDADDLGKSQVNYAIDLFKPIKKKIIGALCGNHEDAIAQENSQNVHRYFVDGLGIRDFGYMAFVRLSFVWRRGKPQKHRNIPSGDFFSVDTILHHGFGGGRSDGADANKFNEFALGYDADLIVAGHTHQRNATKDKVYYIDNRGNLNVRYRIKARAGTYLKTITENSTDHTYAERSGMRPRVEGCLIVTVNPNRKEIIANV